jgi:hypothetical protein
MPMLNINLQTDCQIWSIKRVTKKVSWVLTILEYKKWTNVLFIFFIKDSSDKARKYLEGLDGIKFNEVQVPESLKKQLEFFDRDVINIKFFGFVLNFKFNN